MRTLLLAVLFLFGLNACVSSAYRWKDPAPDAPAPAHRSIVFAPVAVGSLAQRWPTAPIELAQGMAANIDVLAQNAEGFVGESLPDSNDVAWNGRRAGAEKAYLVILSRITAMAEAPRLPTEHSITKRMEAQIELLGIDTQGAVIFRKTATGTGTDEGSAKLMGPVNLPESRATKDALSNALPALRNFIKIQQDGPAQAQGSVLATESALALLTVTIASDPAQADILIDGRFVGSTPQTVQLPAKNVTIRLERTGYKSWERAMIPATGLSINPVLEKMP